MGNSRPSVICETDRLILRPVVPEDADFVFNTMSEPEVNRFIGGFRTLEWHRNRNREIMEHLQFCQLRPPQKKEELIPAFSVKW